MAARHPASQRPPPPSSTDSRPPPRDDHDHTHAHHTHLAPSRSPASPDGEQHAMAPSRHVPSRALRPPERPQPNPYRIPTPPYQHSRNVSLDNLSDEVEETPYVPAVASSSRHAPRVESNHRRPADETRERRPRESTRRPTPPYAGSSRSRVRLCALQECVSCSDPASRMPREEVPPTAPSRLLRTTALSRVSLVATSSTIQDSHIGHEESQHVRMQMKEMARKIRITQVNAQRVAQGLFLP